MCLNPVFGVNPALRTKHVDYDVAVLDNCSFELPSSYNPFRLFGLKKNTKETIARLALFERDEFAIDRFFLANSRTGDTIPLYVKFPCGYCDDCIRSKYFELNSRLQIEAAYSTERVIFGTLTYDDKHLPLGRSLCKDDISDFIHKLYTYAPRYGFSTDFRFFLVGEYGSKYGRPHYHYLLFNFKLPCSKYRDFSALISAAWNRCVVYDWQFARESNRQLTGYVTKYVSKFLKYTSMTKNLPDDFDFDSLPPACPRPHQVLPFWRGSRSGGGLGSPALKDPQFILNLRNSSDGKISLRSNTFKELVKISVPKFLIDKLFPYRSRLFPSTLKKQLDYFGRIWTALYSYNRTMIDIPRNFSNKFRYAFLDCSSVVHKPEIKFASLDSPYRSLPVGPYDLMVNPSNFDYLYEICSALSFYLDSLPDVNEDMIRFENERRKWFTNVKTSKKNIKILDKSLSSYTFVSKSMQTSLLDSKFNL